MFRDDVVPKHRTQADAMVALQVIARKVDHSNFALRSSASRFDRCHGAGRPPPVIPLPVALEAAGAARRRAAEAAGYPCNDASLVRALSGVMDVRRTVS